jgi:cytochrome P450
MLPLSAPILTSDGTFVESLFVAKGTTILVPVMTINRSEVFWGPDAKEFRPERWLREGGLDGVKEIQGYRNLLTFSEGPRLCLGKGFAIAELKVIICFLWHTRAMTLRRSAILGCFVHVDQELLL